jgi:broad specificity phosphatase PhoE
MGVDAVQRQDAPMSDEATRLWIVRHGSTTWSASGQHTGKTDLPLTPEGERVAAALRPRLAEVSFGLVLTSPLERARRTAELAGFGHAEPEPRAVEWDYGAYEGLTRDQIRERVPGWTAWSHPAMPEGERLDEVAVRALAVVQRVRGSGVRDVLLFSHGHFLRVLATTWVGAPPTLGEHLALDPATISELGWDREAPVVDRWNS